MTNMELCKMISKHHGDVMAPIKLETKDLVMVRVYKISICKWLKEDPESAAVFEPKTNGDALILTPSED